MSPALLLALLEFAIDQYAKYEQTHPCLPVANDTTIKKLNDAIERLKKTIAAKPKTS
jgi:hypothetical protein